MASFQGLWSVRRRSDEASFRREPAKLLPRIAFACACTCFTALRCCFDKVDHIGYLKREKEEDLVTALQWCDLNLPAGSYYADWTPFDHPQLGLVEIGGWRYKFVVRLLLTRNCTGTARLTALTGFGSCGVCAVAESTAVSSRS